ncbi:MAG: signal recognition particle-docking protein FtsY [Spartobacteria bacterium]|nr:signal recognition particle-docking protein FtsY [Spartobacteria bacterium]
MAGWWNALAKTRGSLVGVFGRLFSGRGVDDASLEELEEAMICADISPAIVMEWVKRLRDGKLGDQTPREALMRWMMDELGPGNGFDWSTAAQPAGKVYMMLGVNGSGKTTTSAKMAYHASENDHKALLCAADTFRAAGSEQLKRWAKELDVDVVAGATGADASAVVFDALQAAKARRADMLIIDTAGRMHTKEPLMKELQKMDRALKKVDADAPHETWIVLDAALGQNALRQAVQFHGMIPLTGVVISKMDGSSKGGFVFSVKRELGVPIRFIGLGEQKEDLVPFDAKSFVESLMGDGKGS